MHPADVAREIREIMFFKTFNERVLLQLATMIQIVDFEPGELVLKEGELNTKLFFIRSGSADVVLIDEVVARLDQPGDVIGEMSVATERPVTTSIRAATSLQCFLIDSENFKHVHASERDHFYAILYRLYTVILTERLIKTNEKARLFEITNREVHQAQLALERTGEKRVLILEGNKKQLVLARLAVGGTGVSLDTANELADAEVFLQANTYDAILADDKNIDLLIKLNASNEKAKVVLLTSTNLTENFEVYKKAKVVNTIIAIDPEDRPLAIRTILTTLTKVLSQDFFGFEKYLSWGVDAQLKTIRSSKDRMSLRQDMVDYFRKLGIRSNVLDRCNTVAEEILMNAIYDAPVDGYGQPIYNHLARLQEVNLEPHQYSKFRYGSDGLTLAVSVSDPFGSLTKSTITCYLESCYSGKAGTLNEGKGGAGRGLHQIIENSDLTIFNVKKSVRTEVICLFYIDGHRKELAPTFHCFFS